MEKMILFTTQSATKMGTKIFFAVAITRQTSDTPGGQSTITHIIMYVCTMCWIGMRQGINPLPSTMPHPEPTFFPVATYINPHTE